jgi:hypothetical protein
MPIGLLIAAQPLCCAKHEDAGVAPCTVRSCATVCRSASGRSLDSPHSASYRQTVHSVVAAGTGREIWEQTRGRLDAVVLAAGQFAQSTASQPKPCGLAVRSHPQWCCCRPAAASRRQRSSVGAPVPVVARRVLRVFSTVT